MDYVNHLSLADTSLPGGAVIDKIASDLSHGILVNAKTKDAQKTADAGNYWTLAPYKKSLIKIPGYILDQVKNQGITFYAIYKLPEQGVGANMTEIIKALKLLSGHGTAPGDTGPAISPSAQNVVSDNTGVASDTGLPAAAASAKTILPYIIGVILLIGIIYFATKKK